MMDNAISLFTSAMEWLREHYSDYTFFKERDIVWTLQMQLKQLVDMHQLPLKVYDDYPILPGNRRSISTDLALVDRYGGVELAVEIKYEPSHRRNDILSPKFPVVFWGKDGVGGDVHRVRDFVEQGGVKAACSVFIDEDGYYRHRDPHPGSRWIDWGQVGRQRPSVLWSEAGCKA